MVITIVNYDHAVITIVNYDRTVITNVNYDRKTFIVQATGGSIDDRCVLQLLFSEKSQNC